MRRDWLYDLCSFWDMKWQEKAFMDKYSSQSRIFPGKYRANCMNLTISARKLHIQCIKRPPAAFEEPTRRAARGRKCGLYPQRRLFNGEYAVFIRYLCTWYRFFPRKYQRNCIFIENKCIKDVSEGEVVGHFGLAGLVLRESLA